MVGERNYHLGAEEQVDRGVEYVEQAGGGDCGGEGFGTCGV